jgi:hypothetical protein
MKQAVIRSTSLAHERPAVEVSSTRRLFDYQRLFRVSVRHAYYGVRTAAWCDTVPARPTIARMQALGMVFLADRDGCSVAYDTAQRWDARSRFVQRGEPLSFELFPTSGLFANITDMDLDTSPYSTPFRFVNRSPGDQVPARVGTGGSTLSLYAESRPAATIPGRLVQPSAEFRRIPVAIIDIFLGDGDSGLGCPMPPDTGQAPGPAVSYDVLFAARRTFWRYHIVPQTGSGSLDNLTVDSSMFAGPFEETLVNGERAYRFLSKVPIALASQSDVRWSLHGRRRDRMTRDAVLVERLPAPAADQLALLTDDERDSLGVADGGVCSEMFVYV